MVDASPNVGSGGLQCSLSCKQGTWHCAHQVMILFIQGFSGYKGMYDSTLSI
jgi:hypothetical protein